MCSAMRITLNFELRCINQNDDDNDDDDDE